MVVVASSNATNPDEKTGDNSWEGKELRFSSLDWNSTESVILLRTIPNLIYNGDTVELAYIEGSALLRDGDSRWFMTYVLDEGGLLPLGLWPLEFIETNSSGNRTRAALGKVVSPEDADVIIDRFLPAIKAAICGCGEDDPLPPKIDM